MSESPLNSHGYEVIELEDYTHAELLETAQKIGMMNTIFAMSLDNIAEMLRIIFSQPYYAAFPPEAHAAIMAEINKINYAIERAQEINQTIQPPSKTD